jgi:hypothetical protein
MVLPMMIHGGPVARAAATELGAERGLALLHAAHALQGFKGAIEASFGR